MLASFNGTWDWTAIGTLALALVTGISLVFGWNALRQGQREVEEAHRPVVVPIADQRRIEPARPNVPAGRSARPWVNPPALYVPIENVGTGPALKIEATVELLNSAGGWSGAAGGEQPGATVALGASSSSAVEMQVPGLADLTGFWLSLTYDDVAGKGWITKARYVPDHNRYEDLTVNTQKEGAYGLRQGSQLVNLVSWRRFGRRR